MNTTTKMKSGCIERPLSRLFYRYGQLVAARPYWFLILPLLVSCSLGAGVLFTKYETSLEYLFTPENGEAKFERKLVEKIFSPSNGEDTDISRLSRIGQYGRLIVTANDIGGNILTKDVIREILNLDSAISKLVVKADKDYRYSDLCLKWNKKCQDNPLFVLLNHTVEQLDHINITYPTHTIPIVPQIPKSLEALMKLQSMGQGSLPHGLPQGRDGIPKLPPGRRMPPGYQSDMPLVPDTAAAVGSDTQGSSQGDHPKGQAAGGHELWRHMRSSNRSPKNAPPKSGEVPSYTIPNIPLPPQFDIKIFLGNTLGGVKVDSEGVVERAEALHMFYYLQDDNEVSFKWEDEFLEYLSLTTFQHIKVSRTTSRTIEKDLAENTDLQGKLLPKVTVALVILTLFTIGSCIMSDAVRSKPWLGVLGVLSAGQAIVSTFGLMSFCGVLYSDIVAAMPFLILGIGVDNMFVMLAAWRQEDDTMTVKERMGKTFAEAAVSITITSITNALSFGIGAITDFPGVRIFCLYTGVAILFTYIYQITFFGAAMVLTGWREEQNRHSLTCLTILPKSKSADRNALFKFCCAGGFHPSNPDHEDDKSRHFGMIFLGDLVGKLLSYPATKAIVILVFAVYLAISGFGCSLVQEGTPLKRLASDGSYATEFYNLEDHYFKTYGPTIQVIVQEKLDFSDAKVLDKMNALMDEFSKSDLFHPSNETWCWWRDYQDFLRMNDMFVGDSNFTSTLRDTFLKLPPFERYGLDLLTSENSSEISASRFFVLSHNISDSLRERNMMLEARRIAKASDLNVTVYHPAFVFYDQYVQILPNTLQNVGIATASMLLVCLILIPHPLGALWVMLSILSVVVGVVGMMSFWDVNLDSVAMVCLLICVGFSMDYSAHVVYAFVIAIGKDSNARMRSALFKLGLPILQGAVSTILGVSPLGTANAYTLRTFFKIIFLVIILGALHGLLLLPVIMSIFGPHSKKKDSAGEEPTKVYVQSSIDSQVPLYSTKKHSDRYIQTMHEKIGSRLHQYNVGFDNRSSLVLDSTAIPLKAEHLEAANAPSS